jgi:hypothetical protein
MKIWRSHPVLFAALIGAVVGLANALLIEIPGLFGAKPSGALALLKPASRASNDGNVLQTAFILIIEVGANVFAYAALFALAALLFVGIRLLFRQIRNRMKS